VEAALAHFQQTRPQGEFTLVLGGAPPIAQSTLNDVELTEQLQQLLNQGISASDAARQLAATTGLSRRRLYTLLHQDASD
jgi:16S rRNA (cytidine1402-2'-O)-methyltransferase